jgi:hypothetical protein
MPDLRDELERVIHEWWQRCRIAMRTSTRCSIWSTESSSCSPIAAATSGKRND